MNAPIRPLAIQAADALLSNRRSFCIGAGALLGSTLLGGLAACGGSDDDHGDPIWGATGAATLDRRVADVGIAGLVPGASTSRSPTTAQVMHRDRRGQPVHRRGEVATERRLRQDPCAGLVRLAPGIPGRHPGLQRGRRRPRRRPGRQLVLRRSDRAARNVNFHLSANCQIYFSNNPADYAKDGPVDCGANGKLYYARWQGNDCLNFGSPIYARNQSNIAITGDGRPRS